MSEHSRHDRIGALFQEDRVHRDVYISEQIFALEQERLFTRTWLFLGHASQVPNPGDFVTVELARRPLILVRHADGSLHVLMNRCAHKGAMILSDPAGTTGRAFRCPYHGWSYRLDGSLLGVPMQGGYEGTRMRECETGNGLHRVTSAEHRGFVFARLGETGISFSDYFGAALPFIDMMADRSPEGELEVEGPPVRNLIRCNWKMYLENINDGLHVHAAHESAAIAARAVWAGKSPDEPKPMAIEQLLPFQSGNDFMEKMGGRVLANGHSVLGTSVSIHTGYGEVPAYTEAMVKAYGARRAQEILAFSPQNAILYPSAALKSSPQVMRVIRPVAADRTVIEGWSFKAKGAPPLLTERSLMYNRLAFSPMSLVAQDDVHVFETVQRALRSGGNEWVSLHRGYRGAESYDADVATSGTDEVLMRNQYRAWIRFMAESLPAGAPQ